MYKPVVVRVGRTNTIAVIVPEDLSGLTVASEIRKERDINSDLIASWQVSFEDGNVILTMDDVVSKEIKHTTGWMDLKKIVDGEPVDVFVEPLPVVFQGAVTA